MDRNVKPPRADLLCFGPFTLCMTKRLLQREGVPVHIGSRALDILIALVERAGEVVSNRDLIAQAWPGITVDESGLRVHITGLRKALGHGQGAARYVINIPGRGYSFVAPIDPVSTPAIEAAPPAPKAVDASGCHSLPMRLKRMVGREDTVQTIAEQLIEHRFVSIVAAGGMGKTTVAVAIGHALFDAFKGAVIFVDLGSLRYQHLVAETIAIAGGLPLQGSDPVRSLVASFGDQRLLLILDNCEHIVDGAASVAEHIFDKATNVYVLTTSREALRVEGERVHRLRPLEYPAQDTNLTAAEAMTYPAVQLFVERATAAGAAIELCDGDAPIVGEICRSLDGLALAIELAAGRVYAHGLQGTAALLQNRFKLEWHGRRTAIPRHQTLSSMLDWSYSLLPEEERRTLARLSVFSGSFCMPGAELVAGAPDEECTPIAEQVTSLVEKSLLTTLRTANGETRYRLLETTRTYGQRRLVELGEFDAAAERHAWGLLHVCKTFNTRNPNDQERERIAETTSSLGNIRTALAWCFSENGNLTLGIELAVAAAPVFLEASLLNECVHWTREALSCLPEKDKGTSVELLLQDSLATASMFTGQDGREIRRAFERSMRLADELGDHERRLRLLSGFNVFLIRVGDYRAALAAADEGRRIAASLDDPGAIIVTNWTQGVVQHLVGGQAAAQRSCEAGFTHSTNFPTAGTHHFGFGHRVRALGAYARALWIRGFPDQALIAAQQAINEGAKQPVTTCIALVYATPVFLWCGQVAEAARMSDELVSHAERHGLTGFHGTGLGLRGECLVRVGNTEAGIEFLKRALAVADEEQHNIQASSFMMALAEGLTELKEFSAALTAIEGAVARADRNGNSFDVPEVLRVKGDVLAAMSPSDYHAPEACYLRSLHQSRAQGDVSWELRSATSLAKLAGMQNKAGEAYHLLQDVIARFSEGFGTRDFRNATKELRVLVDQPI